MAWTLLNKETIDGVPAIFDLSPLSSYNLSDSTLNVTVWATSHTVSASGMWGSTAGQTKNRTLEQGYNYYLDMSGSYAPQGFNNTDGSSCTISMVTSGYSYGAIGILINEETQQARPVFFNVPTNTVRYKSEIRVVNISTNGKMSMSQFYAFIKSQIIPEFTWHSLNNVVGIDRTLQLTSIKDEFINNLDAVTSADRTNIEYFYEQSSIRQLLGSLAVGQEQRLITTYDNKDEYQPEYKALIGGRDSEGFYIKGMIYELDSPASFVRHFTTGTVDSVNFLGIVIDREHEVASTTQIGYSSFYNNVSYNMVGTLKDSQSDMETLYRILQPVLPEEPEDEPYDEPTSEPERGGGGDNNYTDEDVEIEPLPPSFCTDAGFITLFAPNEAELKSIAQFMWSSDTYELDTYKKIFANPMDCIIGLVKLPVHIPTSGSRELAVGNIGTGINVGLAGSQFIDEDAGSVYIEAERNSFLDYNPYTKLEVFLPFCGAHELNADEYVGKTVNITYRIDLMTGLCTAYLKVNGNVIDAFNGSMGYQIPVTSVQYTSIANAYTGMIFGNTGVSPSSWEQSVTDLVGDWAKSKQSISKSGSTGGNNGSTGIRKPYFLLTSPHMVNPESKSSYDGIPSYITKTIGTLEGYTEIYEVHFASDTATESECAEVERLLKGGIII